MSQANLNGTYQGAVYDPGERNAATLIITGSDAPSGTVYAATMNYYGYIFNVTGAINGLSMTLQAQSTTGGVILQFNLNSTNNSCSSLNGKVYVVQGGPNVGKTYDVTFQKT